MESSGRLQARGRHFEHPCTGNVGSGDRSRLELESTLLRAGRLLETALDLHRRQGDTRASFEFVDRKRLSALLQRTFEQQSARVLMAGDGWLVELPQRLFDLGPGIRVVVGPDAVEERRGELERLTAARAAVRVLPRVPPELALLDERTAVFGGDRMLMINEPQMVSSLHELSSAVWSFGVAFTDYLDRPDGDPEASVLHLLSAGWKDEAAARELRMSVRTYRRHVASLMKRLGAASRFQAGIRAVQLGLIDVSEASRRPASNGIPR